MDEKRRDRSIIIRPEYHLIVSEGTKTEPQLSRKNTLGYTWGRR